jgi:hypothetical protein
MPGEAHAPAAATSAPATTPTRRAWPRPTIAGLWAGAASAAAVVTQFASKAHASVTLDSSHSGAVRYDAGWPWAYAHVAMRGLSRADWDYAAHSPPRVSQIYWGAFAVDAFLLALVFSVGIGLLLGAWGLAWVFRHKGAAQHFLRHAGAGLGIAIIWDFLSTFLIDSASNATPTDQVTWAQISQFPGAELLAPGVIQFAVGRWFATDHGPAIALSDGLAAQVATLAQIALGVLLPAACVTLIITLFVNFRVWIAKE